MARDHPVGGPEAEIIRPAEKVLGRNAILLGGTLPAANPEVSSQVRGPFPGDLGRSRSPS